MLMLMLQSRSCRICTASRFPVTLISPMIHNVRSGLHGRGGLLAQEGATQPVLLLDGPQIDGLQVPCPSREGRKGETLPRHMTVARLSFFRSHHVYRQD